MERTRVVCVGESMAVFSPAADDPAAAGAAAGPAEDVVGWARGVGGAESNVACALAGLGVPVSWVGAVGDDPFGRAVVAAVAAAGVDVTGVVVDPTRPTGLYFKPPGGPVRYYRRGSAASDLGPELLDRLDLDTARLVHLTGITPALSPRCRELTGLLLDRAPLVSFDVNHRPALWGPEAPDVLRALADRADIVLVGDDEARALWGVDDPAAVRALLPGPTALVVKHGERGATLVEDGEALFQPALRVDVVDPVGAGDAFAAGFLAATLAGRPPRTRLRAGHLSAAGALRTRHDIAVPLPADVVAGLLDADPGTWERAHLR